MEDNNKNLLLATGLSFLVIFVWFILFPPAEQELLPEATETATVQVDGVASVPQADGTFIAAAPAQVVTPEASRENALAQTDRVEIKTGRVSGSISLLGGRIDDLHLTDYNVVQGDDSDTVTLLSPANSAAPYYTVHGWAPAGGLDASAVPGATTVWTVESGRILTETTPLTIMWDNGAGLVFRRTISVDENYMFSITQHVENNTNAAVRMQPYGIIARKGEPETLGMYLLHEGVVRAQDGELQEIKYKNMPDEPFDAAEGGNIDRVDVLESGWIGMTDKYWMTTLIPLPGQPFASVSKYTPANDTYQADMRLPVMEISGGQDAEVTTLLFAGAKEVSTIRAYQEELGIDKFVDSVDWGIFFFITKPIFALLNLIHGWIGNMGWSIIGLTLVIKAILSPLAYKSYVSMAKMKKLQPEMEELKKRTGDDKQAMQKEMMELYKKNKVNPASGCLPILLQIPIFFSLYKVLFVTIEMRHAPFIGWIQDLSMPDPSSFLNLFGLLPYAPPGPESFFAIFSIGVFPILMGVTMWMQQKLNPAPTDKTQAMIFAWMPWVFMFMLGNFASGLVIYWVANNTITFIQQYAIMRSQGVKPDVFGNIISSFRKDKDAKE
ncbi:MAG: membrane protein insertase YidC [Rhodobacteraceae bacterium]|nr:MAG: membrane protein insertase YidC [Paracoccaceae bacterium]